MHRAALLSTHTEFRLHARYLLRDSIIVQSMKFSATRSKHIGAVIAAKVLEHVLTRVHE